MGIGEQLELEKTGKILPENHILKHLREICDNCGHNYGSHSATSYYSDHYKMYVPRDYCPGTPGRMDWNNGPGTIFKPTGQYKGGKF